MRAISETSSRRIYGYWVEEAARVIDVYFGREATRDELLHCMGCTAIVGYYWYVWAIYKESQGNAMSEWLYAWYCAAKDFTAFALPAYKEREVLMHPLSEKEFDELVAKERVGAATSEDLKRLEPYRARRAVFFAAGFGSRMLPITVNTPKPLVRVHGKRIIDRLIDAVLAAGIEEIYVVRGYLAEEFDQLLRSSPIRFIDNPRYAETNNISSAVLAKDLFENAYVFESDLYLVDPSLVTKYQYRSNYLGLLVQSTDDWYFDADENGRIVALAKGKDSRVGRWRAFRIGRPSTARNCRSEDIPAAFDENDENKQVFWDEVALRLRADDYDVHVRPFEADAIVEIDSFAELQEVDPAYRIA